MNDILFWYWVLMGVLLLVVLVVIFRSVRRSKFSSRTKKEVAGLLRKHGCCASGRCIMMFRWAKTVRWTIW